MKDQALERTSRVCPEKRPRIIIAAMIVLCSALTSRAQTTPDIEHDPLRCVGVDEYPVIDAGIEPGKELRTAKVYFRAEHFPKYYWVEMVIHDDSFVSVLPKPGPGTKRIIYYIEAVDNAFNNAVDDEHDPEILEVCTQRPAYAPGDEPGIIVGATEAGAAPLPPGFKVAGIVGTVATTGVLTSGIGGGVGVGTAVAVGAGVAGAAAGAVVVANQPPPEESTTSVVPTGSASTTITSTPGSPTGTTTIPGPRDTTTVSTTTTTTAPGPTTTTAPVTTTTPAPVLDSSCFTITVLGACRVQVDATCVALPVDRYEWRLDVSDKWRRIDILNGPSSFIQDWSGDCGSADEMIQFRLKAHRGEETSTSNKSIAVTGTGLRAPPGDAPRRVRFQTHLDFPPFDGGLRGHLVVNGIAGRVIDNADRVVVESTGGVGVNSVAATLIHASQEPGLWRFDFGGDPKFAVGTLRVVQGNVVSLDGHAVVFRLSGQAAERVELTFELLR